MKVISSANTLIRQVEGYESTTKNGIDRPILRSVEATPVGSRNIHQIEYRSAIDLVSYFSRCQDKYGISRSIRTPRIVNKAAPMPSRIASLYFSGSKKTTSSASRRIHRVRLIESRDLMIIVRRLCLSCGRQAL